MLLWPLFFYFYAADAIHLFNQVMSFFFLCSSNNMSSASTQFASPRKMGIFEPNHQIGMWGDSFKADSSQNTGASSIVEAEIKLDNRVGYLKYFSFLFFG